MRNDHAIGGGEKGEALRCGSDTAGDTDNLVDRDIPRTHRGKAVVEVKRRGQGYYQVARIGIGIGFGDDGGFRFHRLAIPLPLAWLVIVRRNPAVGEYGVAIARIDQIGGDKAAGSLEL